MPEELTPRMLERAMRRALAADRTEATLTPEQLLSRHHQEADDRVEKAKAEKGAPLTHKEEVALRNAGKRRS